MKSSSETRVLEQMVLSDAVYSAIDARVADNEARHRLILGDCLGTLAVTLENSYGHRYAGDMAHKRLLDHLANGKLHTNNPVYDPYESYRHYAADIRSIRSGQLVPLDPALEKVFAAYGDVHRATRDTTGQLETDSRHVVHVAALAIPYALKEYPDLDPSLVSSYLFVHDIVEWHVGDTPTINMSPETEDQKNRDEAAALELFAAMFFTKYPKLVRLVEDYESLKDDEAKFSKTYEKLDPGFTHFANAGKVIKELGITTPKEFWHAHHKTSVRMSRYALAFPKIVEDRDTRAHMIEQITWPETTQGSEADFTGYLAR